MEFLFVFIGLMALILINVPIAIGLGVVAVVAMVASEGSSILPNLPVTMYNGATSFPLIAIPLFILAGSIMNSSSISRRLIAFASALFGFMKGGLAMVNIGTSMFFAEISGSAVADVAALGTILIPAMKSKGYPASFSAAVTSSAGSLAVIIPPSIPMILYAAMANTSVVKLFVAGIIPGVLGGVLMMALSYYFARKYHYPVEEIFKVSRVVQTAKDASLAFALPVIILGTIFGGIVTATEGAAIAVVAALIIAAIYRELNWPKLREAILEGAVQTAVVMLLVAASALLGDWLTEMQAPQKLAMAISSWTHNKYLILLLLNVLFLIIGCFLHSAAAIILVVPIVLPLIQAVGIDPVHFGLVVTLNLAIGQQTPPVASVLMVSSSIAKASIWDVTRVNIYYIGVLMLVLFMVTYMPWIGMGLVHAFYGP
jgi:C4-dicarboxylate transporter, DctM subunit